MDHPYRIPLWRTSKELLPNNADSRVVVEYIQDQLDTDLTVSGIAQAVYMSPYHFTRLFKESTGQSPHQVVVEARVRKAKELLTTGKFTISELHTMSVSSIRAILRVISGVFGLPPGRTSSRTTFHI